MSNDVALFEGLANVPAHLQDGELSDIAKALGARQGGDGLKRISFGITNLPPVAASLWQ